MTHRLTVESFRIPSIGSIYVAMEGTVTLSFVALCFPQWISSPCRLRGNKIHFHQTTKDRRILLIPGIHYFDAHRLQPLCGILRFCPLLPSQRPLSLLLVVFWLVSFVVWCFLSFHAINLPVHLDVRSLELRLLRECFPVCLCCLWCLFVWEGKSSAH